MTADREQQAERDPRVQAMIDNPAAYFTEARRLARLEVLDLIQRERAATRKAFWLGFRHPFWGRERIRREAARIVRGLLDD